MSRRDSDGRSGVGNVDAATQHDDHHGISSAGSRCEPMAGPLGPFFSYLGRSKIVRLPQSAWFLLVSATGRPIVPLADCLIIS